MFCILGLFQIVEISAFEMDFDQKQLTPNRC